MSSPSLVAVLGDITERDVDVVVNAANSTLLGGGGVDGAIHRSAGPALLEECRQLGGCETGDARITSGHRLSARWIIHTVGPVWSGGFAGEAQLLASCYRRSLEIADEHQARSIAFPAISTGAYRYPVPAAAEIAIAVTSDWLRPGSSTLVLAEFVCFDDATHSIYSAAIGRLSR